MFTILGLFVSNFSQLSAQTSDDCPLAWDPGAQYYNLPSGFNQQSQTAYVKIYFHVFQKDDGSGGLSTAQIDQAKTLLDNSFNPHGIYFIYDCVIDFIPNSFLFENGLADEKVYPNNPGANGPIYFPNTCIVSSINRHDDGLDIYILSSQNGVHGAAGLAGSIPSDWLVVGGSWEPSGSPGVKIPNALSATLPHEVGHCLGLMHTYTGNINNVKMFCPVAPVTESYFDCTKTAHSFSVCAEFVNGNNCEDCGDRICDTPADWYEYSCNLESYPYRILSKFDCYDPNCHPLNSSNNPEVVDPNCEKYTPDFSNYMSISKNNSLCRTQFSYEQGLVMHNFLQTHPDLADITRTALDYANSIDCNCNPQDVHLYNATTYAGDEIINGNLILHAGADVLVTGTLRFPQGYGIQVGRGARLKVEGGLLTVACDQHHWDGIFVEGNGTMDQADPAAMPQANEAGVVILTLGATIEKAGIATNTIKRSESWNADYWGGAVYAQNAFFKDCYRAAAFMKYRPYVGHANKSRFIDCDIRGTGNYWPNSTGVTIWATDGIQFKENTFEDIKQSGLLVYDAYAEVFYDNLFKGNQYGITGIASAPFLGSMIIGKTSTGVHRNVFEDNYIHVHASGLQHPGKGKYTIANNDFFNGLAGVIMDGTNNYTVRKNSFLNQPLGAVVSSAGADLNYFECNAFQDEQLSIWYAGENVLSQFLENNFLSSGAVDVYLGGTQNLTAIRDIQGTSGWPADNCFSQETGHIITDGPTGLFDYILEEGTPNGSCKKPWCNLSDGCGSPNYYQLFETESFFPPRCGNDDPTIPTDPEFWVKDSLFGYWLAIFQADTSNTLSYHQMVEYGSLRHQALVDQTGIYANNGQDSLVISLLESEATPYAQRLLYGFYLNREQYTNAASVLTALASSTAIEDQHFVAAQQVNLAFYQSPGTFVLDSIQEQLLLDIANEEHEDRAWARAMLIYHTSMEFYPDFPAILRSSNAGVPEKDISEHIWKVYPNPASDLLQLSSDRVGDFDPVEIKLMDMLGRQVVVEKVRGNEIAISTSHVSDGVYILNIHTAQSGVEQHAVIIRR
ncbi:MAG: right-handed parallel beta-helix repeat-containing protein [Saprospiraceae bacterium]